MIPKISKIADLKENSSTAIIFDSSDQYQFAGFTDDEKMYVAGKLEKNNDCIVHKYPSMIFFFKPKVEKEIYLQLETARKAGSKLYDALKEENIETVQIADFSKSELALAFIEGLLLSCYSFDKYKKEKDDFLLKNIRIVNSPITDSD
jgi:leucyl aminopeptidase